MPVVVDPYLLTIPYDTLIDANAVTGYVTQLMEWEKEFVTQTEKYTVSGWAMDAIYKLNLAPTVSNLKSLLVRCGVSQFFSAEDIAPTCDGVIVNCPQMEERAGVNADLLAEIEYIKGTEIVIPDEILTRLHPGVAAEFCNALVYSGYALQIGQEASSWSMATAPLAERDSAAKLTVQATIENVKGAQILSCREWPLLFAPEYLYASYDIADHYQRDPYLATTIAWCKMKRDGENLAGIKESDYVFGPKFLDSLLQQRIQRRPSQKSDLEEVFKAIVRVLERIWSYGSDKHHALREVILDRNSAQQTRKREDQLGRDRLEKAARVEVTVGPHPLRLHYWQCYDGTYEFANVTDDHDDPRIL